MDNINFSRLKKCMCKAENGEELTLGFFGGSITQGSLAAVHENTYAYRVFSWWNETFLKAKFNYVNGGIGGTTSHFGVARVVNDMLMYMPDVVVVDFSVNDDANEFFKETYEGLIRKIFSWESKPAVILLNNVYYDTGKNAQAYHNEVGNWYHIPHVSIRDTVYQKMKDGEFSRDEITPDGLHPNDKGHGLVAEEIIKFLEGIKGHMTEEESESAMPEPITENAYENAKRLTIENIIPTLKGFRVDTDEKKGHLDFFKNGWIGKNGGDSIIFEVEASCIAVQYKKTICRPAERAELILDGDSENAVLLDGNFEEDWGDCLYIEPILNHGERKKHSIEIKILPSEDNENKDITPFYLMSLIIA